MKIVAVHGAMHKGSTYNCAKILIEKIAKRENIELEEIFLPKALPEFCCGCFSCFYNGEDTCPHSQCTLPLEKAIIEADLIILTSPCYVFDVSGQMKAFLDHFGYRWMPHRPHPAMFKKLGVAISTTAGAGVKRTANTMEKSMFFWGFARIFTLKKAVAAKSFVDVSPKRKQSIEKKQISLQKTF